MVKRLVPDNLVEISKSNFFDLIAETERPWKKNYLVMYSSLWNGFTRDPDLMLIYMDDHLVHRGDGVFDAMRCVNGSIYQLERHLRRLKRSAEAIGLNIPIEMEKLTELVVSVTEKGCEKDCIIRITISRGPGGYSTNPYECFGPQIYINVIKYNSPPSYYYEKGVSLITSQYPQKDPFFANIKSCNYLLNVLMKKEAIDKGADYAVGLDKDGYITEGSTENIAIYTKNGYLLFPPFDTVLTGTTALRIKELAETLVERGELKGVAEEKVHQSQVYEAEEVFLTGTSINVVPVCVYDGKKISKGIPGRLFQILKKMLESDMLNNRNLLTPVFKSEEA